PAALEPPVDRRAGGKRVGRDLLGYDLVSVPAQVERALGAAELDLGAFQRRRGRGGVVLGEAHEGAARIEPEDFERVRYFTVVLDGEVAADGGDRGEGVGDEGGEDTRPVVR